ncbi:arginase, putative [Plasmodium vinckei vinckei]|uniref:Arginase n=1 Tax=Plasmodium vinckei vinckei TaxID=54757 RepID=A0A081IBF0_PLAVN|nr:arginase, putative [Plasmodium vinckei vinckei]KEG01008.1 arginase [Plasmodium vinckei vinckei]VEV55061.1 arginase, putative [Plasmodium vinckei vinckei]
MYDYIQDYLMNHKDEKNIYVNQSVSIIGSPLAAGQSLGGVNMACDNLRKLGLHNVIKSVGWEYEDVGNIGEHTTTNCILKRKNAPKMNGNIDIKMNRKLNGELNGKLNGVLNGKLNGELNGRDDSTYYNNIKNVETIGKFSEKLFQTMTHELKKKNFVLNVGGDHGVAFASILSSLQLYKNLKVIWIDAHGDINIPETSPSGNYHGMTLAHALGLFKKKTPYFEWSEKLLHLKPEHVAIIGIRDIDKYEKIILRKCNINYYTMFDIDKKGIYNVICEALNRIDPNHNSPIHISLDIDSVDSMFAPGTGTIAKGGLNYREINLLMKVLADTKRVISMDIVEYNPLLDEDDKVVHGDSLPIDPNATKTGKLCLELIARILGNDIV